MTAMLKCKYFFDPTSLRRVNFASGVKWDKIKTNANER